MSAPVTATITERWCALLDELGLGVWRPGGVGGDVFAHYLPREPAAAVAVELAAGPAADGRHGYDEPIVVVRVRGEPDDAVGAERRAQAVWDRLHGMSKRLLPGGGRVERCFAAQAGPVWVGRDEQGRCEWSVSMNTELRRPTGNRP